jgi:hypothetical protein
MRKLRRVVTGHNQQGKYVNANFIAKRRMDHAR